MFRLYMNFLISCLKKLYIFSPISCLLYIFSFQLIPHGSEKVLLVKLHPNPLEAKYGHTLAVVGDTYTVTLYNMHSGEVISQHKEHEVRCFKLLNPICHSHGLCCQTYLP